MAPTRRQIEAHYKRWNISADRDSEVQRFKNRLLAGIDQTVGRFILERPSLSRRLAVMVGHKQPAHSVVGGLDIREQFRRSGWFGRSFDQTGAYAAVDSASSEHELISALQYLFWILEEEGCPNIEQLVSVVRDAVAASPGIEVKIVQRDSRVTLYPQGARLLDDGLVNEPLVWLTAHPAAAGHFENALRLYLGKDPGQYRNLLDELRSGLEKLLRRLLSNRKSLENQRSALGQWMESRGVHKHIRELYQHLLGRFIEYQNDAVKHGEGWQASEGEVEYMIYLTGTFMRFLLRLESGPEGST